MERLHLNINLNTYRSLLTIAAAEHDTIDGVIRDAISRNIARRQRAIGENGIQTVRARAALRARLAPDFRLAKNWADLDRRLGLKGYVFITIAAELLLQDAEHITVCSLAMLGHNDLKLIRKFGARPEQTAQHRFAR